MKPTADHEVIKEIASSVDKTAKFKETDVKLQGTLLISLPKPQQKEIINSLTDEDIISALNHLTPDKATDLLQTIDKKRSVMLTEKLDEAIREKVEFLLKFNPRAAAGLMSLDFIEVDVQNTIKEVAESIKLHEKNTGKFPAVLVTENNVLLGELLGYALAVNSPKEHIGPFVQKIPTISYDADEKKVINQFLRHPHNKVAVLEEDGTVLGIINSDDVLALLDLRSAKSLYNFAGVNRDEDALDSALTKVKYRWKWLILNLGTAFLAASVVGLFEETISSFVLLAVYMPIVAGMGGNAGTQTMAVTVRGLVLNEINWQTSRKNIVNEIVAGAINGLINGTIIAGVASFYNKSPMLGLVLAVAMVVNLIVAGAFGAIVPMIMKSLGKDPASSATIFITTATDVLGFFVFLGLASVVL